MGGNMSMRSVAGRFGLRVSALVAIACSVLFPLWNGPAQAEGASSEQLEGSEGSVEQVQSPAVDPEPGLKRIAAGVYLAQPVRRAGVSSDRSVIGNVRYGARLGQGTASVVTFVSTPPRALTSLRGPGPQGLPVEHVNLTSSYGMRSDPAGGGRRFHSGIDLAVAAGTPVRATADGAIVTAGWVGGYGLLVAVDHGGELETRYAHLSQLTVASGELVARGDVVGYSGSTGRSTGPHVHYEVRQGGRAIDPLRN